MSSSTYLGLDFSTQQLKAVVVDDNLQILHEAQVQFSSDLPEFRTHGGVIHDKENNVATAPVLMWVKALDMVMDKLLLCGVDFFQIAAVSGSAQQHGSVYWQIGASSIVECLDSSSFLHEQLHDCFSILYSPVWMDSSTTAQCKRLEDAVGGPQKLAEITGSRAYERFTGPQIAKIAENKIEMYSFNTQRISLVSSFACSLFLGKIAPIDYADGSGMNLMNIRTKKWDKTLLDACGLDLEEKLGQPVPSNTDLGPISDFFVGRYGFDSNCRVIAFTGDNPASLIGMRLTEEWLAISLGTSDTMFLWLKEPKVVLEGHILCNPVDPNAYMALLCFKNGSLTRERIRNSCANGSWDIFNELLDSTPRGNFGNMGLYYDTQEILPFLSGDYRYNKAEDRIFKFSSLEVEVRALIEGQFIAKRVYAEDMGFKIGPDTKILATGGASINKSILQVIADVFNAPVYTQEGSNSAVLGAAYQAKIGLRGKTQSYTNIMSHLPKPNLTCSPYQDSEEIYKPMMKRYRKMISQLTESSKTY